MTFLYYIWLLLLFNSTIHIYSQISKNAYDWMRNFMLSSTDKVAIKILDKTKLDQKTQRLLSREISSMEKLHHPNIIRLYEVVETLTRLHLVMEYAGGGELYTKISTEGKLSDIDSKIVFSQVLSAVKHMVRCTWCTWIEFSEGNLLELWAEGLQGANIFSLWFLFFLTFKIWQIQAILCQFTFSVFP